MSTTMPSTQQQSKALRQQNVSDTGEPGKRVIFLDNLKVFLVSLVVVHHASQGYVSINTGWPVVQTNIPEINNTILGLFSSVNNAFFMALFFLVSAYFLPASFDRKGGSKYLKDRLIRLGLPILFFAGLVFPLMGMALEGKPMIQLGHTWFVALLLIFSCAYAAYRLARPVSTTGKKLKTPGPAGILVTAVALALVLFAVRIVFAPGYWTPMHLIEPARLPAYALLFLTGIIAFRNGWLNTISVGTAKVWGLISVVAILAAPLIIRYIGNGYDLWAEGFNLASLAISAWEAFICVGLCVSLPVLFREKFDFRGKVLKAMADDSFAVYLIHPFVLMVLQAMLLNVDFHPFGKFVLVAIAGVALSFGISRLVRKIPYMDRVI